MENEKVLFFSSTSFLRSNSGISSNDVQSKQINLLALLGLIEKLDETQIPDLMLQKAKQLAANKKRATGAVVYRIPTFFTIPSYCDEVLASCEAERKSTGKII